MQQQSYAADLQIHIRFSEEHQGYKVLDIYSVDATKQAAVHIIQRESGFERLCVFASHQRDAALISSADEAYTVSEGDADMQELCCVLGSPDAKLSRPSKKKIKSRNDNAFPSVSITGNGEAL